MAHPIIEEFCRIHSPERMQTVFFRRMQRVLRDEIAPMLDERERLLAENAELKAEIASHKSIIAATGDSGAATASERITDKRLRKAAQTVTA